MWRAERTAQPRHVPLDPPLCGTSDLSCGGKSGSGFPPKKMCRFRIRLPTERRPSAPKPPPRAPPTRSTGDAAEPPQVQTSDFANGNPSSVPPRALVRSAAERGGCGGRRGPWRAPGPRPELDGLRTRDTPRAPWGGGSSTPPRPSAPLPPPGGRPPPPYLPPGRTVTPGAGPLAPRGPRPPLGGLGGVPEKRHTHGPGQRPRRGPTRTSSHKRGASGCWAAPGPLGRHPPDRAARCSPRPSVPMKSKALGP